MNVEIAVRSPLGVGVYCTIKRGDGGGGLIGDVAVRNPLGGRRVVHSEQEGEVVVGGGVAGHRGEDRGVVVARLGSC